MNAKQIHSWPKNDKEIFKMRMGQLINYYGLELVQDAINNPKMIQAKPASNSFWLTSEPNYDVIKMHLNNLELTVGTEMFYIGCVVFYEMEVA